MARRKAGTDGAATSPHAPFLDPVWYRRELLQMPLIPAVVAQYPKTWADWLHELSESRSRVVLPAPREGRVEALLANDPELRVWWWYLSTMYDPGIDDPFRRQALPGYSGRVADLSSYRQALVNARNALEALPEVPGAAQFLPGLERLIAIATRPGGKRPKPVDHRAYILALILDHLKPKMTHPKEKGRTDEALDLILPDLAGTCLSPDSIRRARKYVEHWVNRTGPYEGIARKQ
jgi:hypothetical protein